VKAKIRKVRRMEASMIISRKNIVAVAFLLIGGMLANGSVFQSSYDLFQKALTKEKAEGNLDEAIALFQKVVDKGDDETLAAQAQLHIGICYEKLGLDRARDSYQRVIDRYPRQAEAVKTAKEKLALLATARKNISGVGREINIRRVYDGTGPEWGNALSSDGRYLVYTDWDTGDMAVIDFATRQHRRLTNTGNLRKSPTMSISAQGGFGETSVFSPDDKRIVYCWQGGDHVSELRMINFDGTEPRVLFRDDKAVWIRPHSWSGDGKSILIVFMRKEGQAEIATYSVAENRVNVIRAVAAKDPELALSPDGGTIAFSIPQEPKSSKRDIFMIKTDGTGHQAIVTHPADDYLLGWAPDGRRVIFASDRTGSYGIWSVRITDGRTDGPPQWIKGDLNPSPVRLTPDGTLYYMLIEDLMEVYTVPIDPETGKSAAQPAPVGSHYPGIRMAPDWSPDGTRLAYKSFAGSESRPEGPPLISVLDLKSGEELRIPAGLSSNSFADGPRWAPDGRSVVLIGNRGGETGIYQIDIPGGETKLLISIPLYQYTFRVAWSPDGKSLFYMQGNPIRILRRDLDGGSELELAAMKGPVGIPRIALSPDGKWLAFTSLDILSDPVKLMVVSAIGGPSREIYRTGEGEIIQWLQWTLDGRSIWLKKYTPPPDPKAKPTIEFLTVSPEGKGIRKLDLSLSAGMDFRLHPDGRQLAYWTGQRKIELWALENFLPKDKK